jgi:hypothetical protein
MPSRADDQGYDAWRERFSIVGAWQVEVTVRFNAEDCTTSPPVPFGPNPFPSLNTFHEGGTFSETGSRSPPSVRGPGHGIWKRTGKKTFVVRNLFQGYDPNGLLASNMDMRSEVTLSEDGSTFSGITRLFFSDISGNVNPFCATMEGVRVTL